MAEPLQKNIRTIKILYAAILFNIVLMLVTVVVLKEIISENKVNAPTPSQQVVRITGGIIMLLAVLICKKIFKPIQLSTLLREQISHTQYLAIMKRILLVTEVVSFIILMAYFFTGDFYLVIYAAILLGFLLYIAPTTNRLGHIKDV